MPSDFDEKRPARAQGGMSSQLPPKLPEPLPCPRCDSTSTKFCYYNNYNLSQPRHFCKSCRRYWTKGGTLRNVPVGGGTRRTSTKRSRSSPAASALSCSVTSTSSSSTVFHEPDSVPVSVVPIPANPVSVLPGAKQEMGLREVNLNESVMPENESFASLMDLQGQGFLALGGYGFGLGSGFDEMGLGFGRGVWPFHGESGSYLGGVGVGHVDGGSSSGATETTNSAAAAAGCNTWQLSDVEGGDCFAWPGLEISMRGKGLK